MANYNSNYDIAREISARIGNSPIPFDSVYSICLKIYNELGGEPAQFDSVYEILLGILPLVEGGGSNVIDDTSIRLDKTWSSSKINEEIQAVAGTSNSDIEGKETEDFTFVTELPTSGEEDAQVIIKGENTDTLYKYVSGSWVEQTPDATKLYFDTENEALYSYVSADHQFAPVSLVNTIVVGSNLNTNTALKAIKTPGVYSVVQRLHSSTKGDYIKNWTLTVEGIDYDEYERTDSIYQRIQSNYTIQKRTWSSTRATNDGWSNFSTYYAGEIKDNTISKYYTWSSNKLNSLYEMPQDMFRLISRQDGSTIYINNAHTAFATSSYRYSLDGVTWNTLSDTAITVNLNKVIYIKGIAGQATATASGTAFFITTGNFDAYGNLGWLYDVSNPNATIYKENTMIGLFKDAVISNMDVWCNVKKIENYALNGMFRGSHITSSVKFNNILECKRATYWYRDCTSLVNAYPLYFENLCDSMAHLYNGCTALRNVYVECDCSLSVGNMFSNCTALENIYFVVHYYTYATYGAASFAANVPSTCNVYLTDYAQYVLNNTTLTLTKDISTTKIYDKDIQTRKGSEFFLMSANIVYRDDGNSFYFPTLKPTDNITYWNYLSSHTYLYIQEVPIGGGDNNGMCRFTICFIDAQTIKAMGYLNGKLGVYKCAYDSTTDTMTHTFTPIN